MSDVYRIWGAEMSPFSVKVRSYFRYKDIPHDWQERSPSNIEEYKKYSKLPLVPTVATPEDEGWQDSTPILEKVEARFPDPSIHPSDPASHFISALLEEFGDEWGNKWMFHQRWAATGGSRFGRRAIGRWHGTGCGRGADPGHGRPGQGSHGEPGLVRRIERRHRAPDREVLSRRTRPAEYPSVDAALPVRGAPGICGLRPLGPDLQRVDRPRRPRAGSRTDPRSKPG